MITEEQVNKNFVLFQDKMKEIGIDVTELIKDLGNEIKNGTFTSMIENGMSYEGSLLQISKEITSMAFKINEILPESIKINKSSLLKVCFLQNISKSLMFVKTKDDWKIRKGFMYEFSKYDYALKTGMRSIGICLKYGITFSDEELEGMICMDRSNDDDQSNYMSSPISIVIKQATLLINAKYKVKK